MNKEVLENEILKTLSFMEPMSLEHILLDLDKDFSQNHPELTYEDLVNSLIVLKRQKRVKNIKTKDQQLWIKIFPKRSWWKRFLAKL